MKIQDYCLSEEVRVMPAGASLQSDPIILAAGTFVKPIHLMWVPKHVVEASVNRLHNTKIDVFCYCSAGIVSVPRKSIREI